jgi:hypothetical protein
VHHQAAGVEGRQRLGERDRAVVGVEVEDAGTPLATVEHAGGLVRPRCHAGRNDQVVIGQPSSIGQHHHVAVGVDPVDLAVHQVHPVRNEPLPRLDHLIRRVLTERQEQIAGLVEVPVAGVDRGYLPLGPVEAVAQLVDHHRACRPGAEYQ